MVDLIRRQAAIDALNEYFARIGKLKRRGLTKGEKAISLDTVGAIKTLPSVQPERKKGDWEYIEKREPRWDIHGVKTWAAAYRCSKCGFIHTVIEDFGIYKYCPECGADMKGERKMKEDTIKINVEADGIDETTEKMEALVDVMDGFPPQVTIKNCRDCTINIYPSQTKMVEQTIGDEQDDA